MDERDILIKLRQAILDYDAVQAEKWSQAALAAGVDPREAVDVLTQAVRLVGESFSSGELWLPDLIGAGDAMKGAMHVLDAELAHRGAHRNSPGVVVLGTVFGDLHDIGKAMVATLLTADGFRVHDLGINVAPERFVEAAKSHQADIVAMSALLTTSTPEMRTVLDALQVRGLRGRVKVIVGGAAVTQEFADSIGADGYEPTAFGAVALARGLTAR